MIPDLPDVCQMPLEKAAAELITKQAKHGEIIPLEWLTRNLRVEGGSSRFNSRMVKLRRLLAEQGFSLSRAGLSGKGYRILGKMETVEHVAARDRRRATQTFADARMLHAIDGSDLSPTDRAKLDQSQNRAMTLYVNAISIIHQRNLPPLKPTEALPFLKVPEGPKQAQ